MYGMALRSSRLRGGSHGFTIVALCISGLLLVTVFFQAQNQRRALIELNAKHQAEVQDYQDSKNNILWKFTEKQDEAQHCHELMKSKTEELNQLEIKMKLQEQEKADVEAEKKNLMDSVQTKQTTIDANEEKVQGLEAALKKESEGKKQAEEQIKKAEQELNSQKSKVEEEITALKSKIAELERDNAQIKLQKSQEADAAVFRVKGSGKEEAQNQTTTTEKQPHKAFKQHPYDQVVGGEDYLSKADIADVLQGNQQQQQQETYSFSIQNPDTQQTTQQQQSSLKNVVTQPKNSPEEAAAAKDLQQDFQQFIQQNNNSQLNYQHNFDSSDQAGSNNDQGTLKNGNVNQKSQNENKQSKKQQQNDETLVINPDQVVSEIKSDNYSLQNQNDNSVFQVSEDGNSGVEIFNQGGDQLGGGLKKYEFKKDLEGGNDEGVSGGRNSYEKDDNETGDFQDDDPSAKTISGESTSQDIAMKRRGSGQEGGQIRGGLIFGKEQGVQQQQNNNSKNVQNSLVSDVNSKGDSYFSDGANNQK